MDRLEPFFEKFSLTARMFYSGQFCGISGDHESEYAGHLHVLKKGTMKVIPHHAHAKVIDRPSILFFPRRAVSRSAGRWRLVNEVKKSDA